jgi:hypothetical protein
MKALEILDTVNFPNPSGVAINMMPFIYGDKNSLPGQYRQYHDLAMSCKMKEEIGKVCYLTVSENWAVAGNSHRRSGIHTEARPNIRWGGGGWGGTDRSAGIYIASTVANTTRLWDAKDYDMGEGGSLEHKKEYYPENGILLNANQLAWMTDVTPHESVPVKETVFRQFFRLVSSNIGAWFKEKNTFNSLGVMPTAPIY